jgi:hypothetical protein
VLLRFAPLGRLGGHESAERWAVGRTRLRRVVPSFTVEVRRRPRLATTSNPNAQSSATKPAPAALAAFDQESQRAAVAAFGAQGAYRSPVVDVAASHPTGRILPSLVPREPRLRYLEDVPVSTAESQPLSRAAKRKDQPSKSPRSSNFSSDENALMAERPSTGSQRTSRMRSDEGAVATPRDPTRAPSPIVGDANGLALSGKGRKRTIMARYVFRDEDKPGEGWKRRLLGSR